MFIPFEKRTPTRSCVIVNGAARAGVAVIAPIGPAQAHNRRARSYEPINVPGLAM
jgi:hypothetical protein